MYKWGDSERHSDPVLAVWAHYSPEFDRWIFDEFALEPGISPRWRRRMEPTANGFVRLAGFEQREEAISAMTSLNQTLALSIDQLDLPEPIRASLHLKVAKALQAKTRLADEELLMRHEAIKRGASLAPVAKDELKLPESAHGYRDELITQLELMPYIDAAIVGVHPERRVLFEITTFHWSKPYRLTPRLAEYAFRAQIAGAFGFRCNEHWGKVKAAIRAELLPRANQLLQLASVQRLLAEARAQGKSVLVSNGIVFWYEADGQVGWQVKHTKPALATDGDALWHDGTILSKNHGRLVILPFIKESGEKVQGHTRNAAGDGRAKPRHPEHYVTIPFEVLDGDLMIGLYGELPYE